MTSNTPIELTPPFAVYGGICGFWDAAGGLESTYGRPICDEQGLPDGSRCSIFEGGHIHWYNGEAMRYVSSLSSHAYLVSDKPLPRFPANECTAPYKPRPPQAQLQPSIPTQINYQSSSSPAPPHKISYPPQTSHQTPPPTQPQFSHHPHMHSPPASPHKISYPPQTSHQTPPSTQSQPSHHPHMHLPAHLPQINFPVNLPSMNFPTDLPQKLNNFEGDTHPYLVHEVLILRQHLWTAQGANAMGTIENVAQANLPPMNFPTDLPQKFEGDAHPCLVHEVLILRQHLWTAQGANAMGTIENFPANLPPMNFQANLPPMNFQANLPEKPNNNQGDTYPYLAHEVLTLRQCLWTAQGGNAMGIIATIALTLCGIEIAEGCCCCCCCC